MAVLYVDTMVFLDAILDRDNLFGNNIGKPAAVLFSRAIKGEFRLAVSMWTLKEIYKQVDDTQVRMLFEMLKPHLDIYNYDDKDIQKAKDNCETNFDDALHIVIAEREDVDIIITRNIDHFKEIGTSIPLKKPEWI